MNQKEKICPFMEKHLCNTEYGYKHCVICTGKSEACEIRKVWLKHGLWELAASEFKPKGDL